MGLRRHLQTNQVLASCPIPTALGSTHPQLRAPHSQAGSLISTHGLQPCEDEGRNLSVFSDHPISHKAIISISPSFHFFANQGTLNQSSYSPHSPHACPLCLLLSQLRGSKNRRESLVPRYQIVAPSSKPPSHAIDIQGMGSSLVGQIPFLFTSQSSQKNFSNHKM